MSKIICDVCGSRYPDTSAQCPICGCMNSKAANQPEQTQDPVEVTNVPERTTTPGGRFSKANVNKRNQGKPVYEEEIIRAKPVAKKERLQPVPQVDDDFDLEEEFEEESGKKRGSFVNVLLVLVIIALLGVCAYIFIQYLMPSFFGGSQAVQPATEPVVSVTEAATEATQPTLPPNVPCQKLVFEEGTVVLEQSGQTYQLNVKAQPENTTDGMIYISSNEDVATVGDDGVVTAVGEGSVVITVFCGGQQLECNVICNFSGVPVTEAPAEAPTEAPAEAPAGDTPAATEAPAAAGEKKTVTSKTLNIRKEASSKSDLVGSLKKGDVVTVYEQKKVGSQYWGRIDNGWVCMDYVK